MRERCLRCSEQRACQGSAWGRLGDPGPCTGRRKAVKRKTSPQCVPSCHTLRTGRPAVDSGDSRTPSTRATKVATVWFQRALPISQWQSANLRLTTSWEMPARDKTGKRLAFYPSNWKHTPTNHSYCTFFEERAVYNRIFRRLPFVSVASP